MWASNLFKMAHDLGSWALTLNMLLKFISWDLKLLVTLVWAREGDLGALFKMSLCGKRDFDAIYA